MRQRQIDGLPGAAPSATASLAPANASYVSSAVVPAGRSMAISRPIAAPASTAMPSRRRRRPRGRATRLRASMCSIAEMSSPERLCDRHVCIAALRRRPTSAERSRTVPQRHERQADCRSDRQDAQGGFGDNAERAFRPDEQVDRDPSLAPRNSRPTASARPASGSAEPGTRSGSGCGARGQRSHRGWPSVSPRRTSSTSPDASTTVSASTHARVVPYLNVAAPAALVAMVPPMVAPCHVGRADRAHRACAARCASISAIVTPAPDSKSASTVVRRAPQAARAQQRLAARRRSTCQRRLCSDREHGCRSGQRPRPHPARCAVRIRPAACPPGSMGGILQVRREAFLVRRSHPSAERSPRGGRARML